MEHTRDNNSSPHPTEDPATGQISSLLSTTNGREYDTEDPASPSLPSSTANSQHSEGKSWSSSLRLKFADVRFKLSRLNPLFQGLERPSFSRIVALTVLCLITYPVFYILTLVAKDKSLFIVRAIVSVWCSGVGFALGYILLKIGARHLEAATWATVIHMSHEGGGMKLRDLARGSSNPTSFMPAFHTLRSRFRDRETFRRSREPHDKRPWSIFLAFFIVLSILAPLLPFLFGRIMGIETFIRSQSKVYREVLIAGDLSQGDMDRLMNNYLAFQVFYQTWSLLPYGENAPDAAEFVYGNDTVYFAQPSLSQFLPGGSGAGTFNLSQSVLTDLKDIQNNTLASTGTPKNDTSTVLRYPQWGIRIHCEKLPRPEIKLIPLSSQNFTYTIIPQDFLRSLFGVYGMDLPAQLAKPDLSFVDDKDTIPSNIDNSTISYIVKWPDNGEGVSLHTITNYNHFYRESDQEWTAIDTVLVRFDTMYTPSGHFPVYLNTSKSVFSIGYDVVVCVQKYEPWILETYNASIVSPSALRIVEKGDINTSPAPSGNVRGAPINNTRYLRTTGKDFAFTVAHLNSVNQMVKNNGRDIAYLPSSTAVSFTEGTGPWGYTELSPVRLAVARARVGAANTLPFLVGSGHVVAQSYQNETLAFVIFEQWQLILLPVLVLILGIVGELFVPTLPLNVPQREFGVYSWLAVFQSQELQFEAADDLHKFMSLDELEETFSDKRVRFVA